MMLSRSLLPEGLRPPASRQVLLLPYDGSQVPVIHAERKGSRTDMSTTLLSHAPELIAAHMRAAAVRRQRDQAGPFRIGFDPHSNDPFRNYAVPAGGARTTPDDVQALIPEQAAQIASYFRRQERGRRDQRVRQARVEAPARRARS